MEDRSPGETGTAWMPGRILRVRSTADFQYGLSPVKLAAATSKFGTAKLRNRQVRLFGGDAYRRSAAGEASREAMAILIDGGIGGTDTGHVRHGFPQDTRSQFLKHMPFEADDRQSLPSATPGLVRSGFRDNRSGDRQPDLRRPLRVNQDG